MNDAASMKPLFLGVLGLLLLGGCSSTARGSYIIPDDMPEICRSVNFDEDPGMMKPCGVKTKVFRGRSTDEIARPLIQPRGALLAHYEGETELRLPSFKPVVIPPKYVGDITFTDRDRLKSIANKMDYLEYGSQVNKKFFRISLPQENGAWTELCFQVRDDSTLRPVSCKSFSRKIRRNG